MGFAEPVIGRACARPVGSTHPAFPAFPSSQKYDYDNCRAAHVCEPYVMRLRENTSPELVHFLAKNVVAPRDLFSEN
jgi:hypothetical protein